MTPNPNGNSPAKNETKRRFFEQVITDVQKMTGLLIQQHPELDGLCVTFLWNVDGKIPSGTVMLKPEIGVDDTVIERIIRTSSNFNNDLIMSRIAHLHDAYQLRLKVQQSPVGDTTNGKEATNTSSSK